VAPKMWRSRMRQFKHHIFHFHIMLVSIKRKLDFTHRPYSMVQALPARQKAEGRSKDHAAFSPGNAASSVTMANLRHAIWSAAPLEFKAGRASRQSAKGVPRNAKKPN